MSTPAVPTEAMFTAAGSAPAMSTPAVPTEAMFTAAGSAPAGPTEAVFTAAGSAPAGSAEAETWPAKAWSAKESSTGHCCSPLTVRRPVN
jgi:hypothetical protein